MVKVELKFNENKAKSISEEREIRVLVTNLPRAGEYCNNTRFGATADTVLKTYLDQYKIEHAFRKMKSGMGMSCVYIHRPSRENAMMFVIAMATMVSDVVRTVLKKQGVNKTLESIANDMPLLMLNHDRGMGEENLVGPRDQAAKYLEYLEKLNLDPDRQFG